MILHVFEVACEAKNRTQSVVCSVANRLIIFIREVISFFLLLFFFCSILLHPNFGVFYASVFIYVYDTYSIELKMEDRTIEKIARVIHVRVYWLRQVLTNRSSPWNTNVVKKVGE